jgi:hypothetical protein
LKARGNAKRASLCVASSGNLSAANVHYAVEEGSACYHGGFALDYLTALKDNPGNLA